MCSATNQGRRESKLVWFIAQNTLLHLSQQSLGLTLDFIQWGSELVNKVFPKSFPFIQLLHVEKIHFIMVYRIKMVTGNRLNNTHGVTTK